MALINCRECGKEVSSEAVACPGCGAKPTPPAPKETGTLWTMLFWAGGTIGAILVFGSIAGNSPQAKEKQKARAAISLCEEDVKDDLLARETRLMVRGFCDKMKDDFRHKYGVDP